MTSAGATDRDRPAGVALERGWVRGARRVESPNNDARPPGTAIELLVVHGISLPAGCYGGPHIEALFCNRLDPDADPSFAALAGLRVSAHLLVRRDGELIQFCPFDRRAWHAGISCHAGRPGCNDFSVGIELEGCDRGPYEPVQYRVLAALALALMARYPGITPERIVGHSDIAPGRKTDPGPAFEWARLRRLLSPAGSPGAT